MKSRLHVTSLQKSVKDVIISIIGEIAVENEELSLPVRAASDTTPSTSKSQKCYVCLDSITGLPDAERRLLKGRWHAAKNVCQNCNKRTCTKHSMEDSSDILKCQKCY